MLNEVFLSDRQREEARQDSAPRDAQALRDAETPRSWMPQAAPAAPAGDEVTVMRTAILAKLAYALGKTPETARDRDWFVATALALRDRAVAASAISAGIVPPKRVHYLSLEFLIGRLLSDAMGNLGVAETVRAALAGLDVDLDAVAGAEPDAALGNGGLGRLAACFMESMASLAIPAYGYGIRYDHGLFRQVIEDGVQREAPETWLSEGNPWEFERVEAACEVGFGGDVAMSVQPDGTLRLFYHLDNLLHSCGLEKQSIVVLLHPKSLEQRHN